jgi:hypothetical protein
MTIIELEVPDDKMVPKVVQVCKMLIGVSSVKVQRKPKAKSQHQLNGEDASECQK